MRTAAFDVLPDPVREEVLAAARETEASQFALLESRTRENYARMRGHGVAIADPPPRELVAHLKAAAAPTLAAWRTKVPAAASDIVEGNVPQ